MEESVVWQFNRSMEEILAVKELDVREYSPLTLAQMANMCLR